MIFQSVIGLYDVFRGDLFDEITETDGFFSTNPYDYLKTDFTKTQFMG